MRSNFNLKTVYNNTFFQLIILIVFFISCKNSTEKNILKCNIDLSIIRNKSISSFKIDSNGSAINLINSINEKGVVNQVFFNEEELIKIRKKIDAIIVSKCDTIDNPYMDGLRYIMIITEGEKKRTYVSCTCKESEPIDNLVIYINELYNKKNKVIFYNSLEKINIPSVPRTAKSD